MPNYVENILIITSKNDDAEDVINFIKQHYNEDGFFDFNTFVPEPTSEEECPDKYNFNTLMGKAFDRTLSVIDNKDWFNWYDWRIHYWGTKWNGGEESRCYFDFDKIREGYSYFSPVYIHFSTAWNAPYPIFRLCYILHPELNIEIISHSTENETYEWFGDERDVIHHCRYNLEIVEDKKILKDDGSDDNEMEQ